MHPIHFYQSAYAMHGFMLTSSFSIRDISSDGSYTCSASSRPLSSKNTSILRPATAAGITPSDAYAATTTTLTCPSTIASSCSSSPSTTAPPPPSASPATRPAAVPTAWPFQPCAVPFPSTAVPFSS